MKTGISSREALSAPCAEYGAALAVVERLRERSRELAAPRPLALRAEEIGASPEQVWDVRRGWSKLEQRMNDAIYLEELGRIELRLALGIP